MGCCCERRRSPIPSDWFGVVQTNTRGEITIPEYQFVKEQGRAFSSMAAYRGGGERRLEAPGVDVWVMALAVSTSFLDTFGRPPIAGREFTVEETRVGGPQAAMISEALWRSGFGADAGVVGTSINLNGAAFTVVGVLPAEFSLSSTGRRPGSVAPCRRIERSRREYSGRRPPRRRRVV